MIFPAFSRRHRFAPLLAAIALAALLAGAAHTAEPAAPASTRAVETPVAAWLYPLLAAPVLVRLLESDSP